MHIGKHALQFKRFRRRIHRFKTLSSVEICDRSQNAALFSPFIGDSLDQISRRRLTVCAGHAEYQHLVGRASEEIGGNRRESLSSVSRDNYRNPDIGQSLFRDDSGCSRLLCSAGKRMPVALKSSDTDEDISRARMSRIITHAGDLDILLTLFTHNIGIFQ